jgi:hypothetical protein
LREAAGRTARKRIEANYLWSKVASDIEKYYFEILGLPLEAPIPTKVTVNVEAGEDSRLAARIAG